MIFLGKLAINTLTLIHLGIVFVILFGWLFPSIVYVYGFCLISTALSWLIFNRCILVDVEYFLRKLFKQSTEHVSATFTATFVNNVCGRHVVSDNQVYYIGVVTLTVSIPYWAYVVFV